ncbi:MAG TPA: tetratricopeptide repeat protein [Polyangia bacterium]
MRAALAAVVAATVALGGVARAETTTSTTQQRFAAATMQEAHGQFAEAAAALETLGHDSPADSFAADALFEAALVSEERLADPTRARRLYAEVAAKYPSSRLARRAKMRADFLARSLSTGEAPLREYDDVLANAAARPRAESRARMEALLQKWPDFALADRALYWLGQRLAEEHRLDEAIARFAECERRFPSSEWALRSKKSRADILLSRGHPFVARAVYRELLASSDALARSAGKEGLADSVTWLVRGVFIVACILYLLAFAWLQLRVVSPRARLAVVPIELLYYLPVAVLFVAAALTENRAIGIATSAIAVGGAIVVWLTSVGLKARLDRGPMSPLARAGRIAAITLAVVALMFLAVQATGLTDVVVETLRTGPERG